ncbi:uncharacterized protein B0H18DRAFT_832582, partial [Fomitopsis serialis]|uniref:uncharacterized protein n=1 Tax=Fomitopsis serialis TaxID=139415 RepID=UPI002008B1E5
SVEQRVTRLWEQFKYDLIDKAPGPRDKRQPSYMIVSQEERVNAPDALFQSPELPFSQVRVIKVERDHWRTKMFDRYFPLPNVPINHALQNFTNCTYWKLWGGLVGGRTTPVNVNLIRGAVFRLYDELLWLPYTESDRIWTTKTTTAMRANRIPCDSDAPAPLLAINPR